MTSHSVKSSIVSRVFGASGSLSEHFEGYEPRPEQVKLSEAIAAALTRGEHLLAEGPCGTGKSLAYLVPAIDRAVGLRGRPGASSRQGEPGSGPTQPIPRTASPRPPGEPLGGGSAPAPVSSRVVVATGNLALQDQLVTKDLPLLAKVMPEPFRFGLLKGRSNYVCRNLLESFEPSDLLGADDLHDWRTWLAQTGTGDKSELRFVPDYWPQVSTGADDCLGKKCKHRETCYAQRAKQRAEECDVIVTNYHMIFADVVVRQSGALTSVVPAYEHLIMDEGHEAANIARGFFQISVSWFAFLDVIRMLRKTKRPRTSANELEYAAKGLFALVLDYYANNHGIMPIRTSGLLESVKPSYSHVVGLLKELAQLEGIPDMVKGRIEKLLERTQKFFEMSDSNLVYWLEVHETRNGEKWVKCMAKPVDVSGLIRAEVFDRCKSVVVTSATLTTGVGSDKFSYIRNEIGAPQSAKEITVDSPFDFSKQALLVVPAGIPHPNAEDFMEAAVDAMREAILACHGRALVLFTARKRLEYAYERLSKELGYRVLMQGQAPVKELVRIFKEDTSSVLLGTNSLWTGVDVSGEALTCLIIDRIPFATPDDPVAIAIQNKLGDAAFFRYSVPSAIITFRQGFGRLIRSKTDKGVVVMLDNRLVEKGYGQRFIRALPRGLRVTRDVGEILGFLPQ